MLHKLKELRIAKGISQQKLASVLGVSQQSINKYENHDVEPDITTLIAMADYFETTVDILINRKHAIPAIHEADLSEDESTLIEIYRRLDVSQKACIQSVAQHIQNKNA